MPEERCKYCEVESVGIFYEINDDTIQITNRDKFDIKFWRFEVEGTLSIYYQGYDENAAIELLLNFCPMCGRKFDKNKILGKE